MKHRKPISLALSATLLLTTSLVWAGPDHGDRGHGRPSYHGRDDDRHDHGGWDHGGHDRYSGYYRYHGHPPVRVVHHWRRGEALPAPYRGHRYVVRDYYYYGLPRPVAGHRWVRVDDDFLLTAIATGVIVSIIARH